MITKLTPQQEAQIKIYSEKWLKLGLSTQRANREEVNNGIQIAYELAGLPQPEIIWSNSPAQYKDSGGWVDHLVYLDKISTINRKIGESIDSSLLYNIRNHFRFTINDNIFTHIWDFLDDSFPSTDLCYLTTYSEYTYEEFGFYDYCQAVLNIDLSEIHALQAISKTAGWWFPCEKICFVYDRPSILSLDSEGHPHCEDGFAIGYSDSWGLYAWHGVIVSEYVIMRPHEITLEKIVDELDEKVSDAMVERYGKVRFISEGGVEVIRKNNFGTSITEYDIGSKS